MAVAVYDFKGLIVPVIRNADGLNLLGMAKAISDVADRARAKRLHADEVRGGTFTITSPGGFGSIVSTPIINQPQVGILDVEAVAKRPVVVEDASGRDAITIRPMMNLCLSYGHRVVDGAYAVSSCASRSRRPRPGRPTRIEPHTGPASRYTALMGSGKGARRLNGRVVLVTGAGRGIGRSIGIAVARAGARVVLVSRTLSDLDSAREEIEAVGGEALLFPGDLTRDGFAAELIEHVEVNAGPIDGLVNAAGINTSYSRVERVEEEDWDRILATNVRATFLLSQTCAAAMLERGSGSITNIASVGGIVAIPRLAAYCASKSALIALTRTMAVEWAKRGVRVNAVAPAFIRTSLSMTLLEHPHIAPRLLAATPMGRFGESEDVAGAVTYLLSDDARYITGETLSIDGGWTAH